jgi:hypothetical protein
MAELTDGRRVVQASEILEKIQKGEPVECDNVIIEGDLNLSELDLPTQHIERTEAQKKWVFPNLVLPDEAKLVVSSIKITNTKIDGMLNFANIIIQQPFLLNGSQLSGNDSFEGTIFNGDVNFVGAMFSGNAYFEHARFNRDADFFGATFNSFAAFWYTTFNGRAGFGKAMFNGDTNFEGATFDKNAAFWGTTFSGDFLIFRNAKFNDPMSQEAAYRRAKNVLEKNGDREEAGFHFYWEMDSKRKQKPWYISYPELIFIQWIFGYGVHPLRLWACWLVFVGLFAILYWSGHGIDEAASQLNGTAQLRDYIWFSIATAITPGYAGYKPTPDFKLVAGLEAILGTFMWAAFIATFARKYMR